MQSIAAEVFFGGDAAFGPKNIIWAVAHGHEAAVSIDTCCSGEDVQRALPPLTNLVSQKMGIHEWSYDNDISNDLRFKVPLRDKAVALKNIKAEVELGFDPQARLRGGAALPQLRCRDGVHAAACASNAMPASTSARWIASPSPTNGEEDELRARLSAPAPNLTQDLYVSSALKTGRIMAKDEDVCLHCGLCAERCPTGAWDMQKFTLEMTYAGQAMPIESSQRFRRQFRQRQRFGLGERESDCSPRSILRMGVPVAPRNIFPSNIQGLPTWYEVRVSEAGHLGRARRHRSDGRDESADLGQGCRLDRARRLPVLRFVAADAAVEIPRRHQRHRRAADRDLQSRNTPIRASASCSRTSSMSARSRPCSTSRSTWSRR